MRRVFSTMWVALALCATGCPAGSGASLETDDSPPMGVDPGDSRSCFVDNDCTPAASTCCECPSFSISVLDGFGDGCSEVDCEGLREDNCSTLAQPACVEGQCELGCRPLALEPDELCDLGFARDELGCATKTCGALEGTSGECVDDSECVQVNEDCCGCEMGGSDTAVSADQAASFQADLGCTGNEACPGVFICEPGVIPQCLVGRCVLAADAPPDMGPDAPTPCGLTELPACPAGEVCTLNDPESNDAGPFGVGVCRPE